MDELDLIKNDAYINDFIKRNNLTEEYVLNHLNVFKRVIESRNKCVSCKGLYMCNQNGVGERLDVKFDQILIEEIEYCDYMLQKNKENSLSKSFVFNDIPECYNNVCLENIKPYDDENGLFVQLYDILEKKNNNGLYICGDMGVGKTYLCIALANSLVKKGEKVAFVKISSFINEMRRLVANDSQKFDEYLNKLKDVDYLFLDDIGSESVSTFSRDDILFTLLDYRMENNKITIFTSNLSKQDIVKHYTYDKRDNSSLLRAKRLVERMDILGKDYIVSGINKRREI